MVPKQLTIPALPALKLLEILDGKPQRKDAQTPTPFIRLAPFAVEHFTSLDKLVIRTEIDSGILSIFDFCRFESVTELVEYGSSLRKYDWARVFPNLRLLRGDVNRRGLLQILRGTNHLLELDLRLIPLRRVVRVGGHVQRYSEGDINAILSGFLNPQTGPENTSAWLRNVMASPLGTPSIHRLSG